MSVGEEASARGPGRLRITGLALAALGLTSFFLILGFPYDRLAGRIAAAVEARTGAQIVLGPISPGLVRFGPGLESEGVRVLHSDGTRLDLDHVGVRPALALAWLRGDPALATDFSSKRGGGSGIVTLGSAGGFDGHVEAFDLELLPRERLGSPLQIKGHADADVDLVFGADGPQGSVVFEAKKGVVAHPHLPLPMPYETLSGELELGGDEWVRIRSLALESPLANGRVRGTIGRAPRFANAPLRLQVEFAVSGAIQGSLNAQGVKVGSGGQIQLEVTGTPTRPVVR